MVSVSSRLFHVLTLEWVLVMPRPISAEETVYQYKVDYGGQLPLSYWTKTELAPGMVIDTPGHPLKILNVAVRAEPLGDERNPGQVGRANADRLLL